MRQCHVFVVMEIDLGERGVEEYNNNGDEDCDYAGAVPRVRMSGGDEGARSM